MLTALTNFKASIQDVICFADHINANTSQTLKDRSMRNMFQTMRCAAVVAVSGYFEYFLKELAKGFITSLNTKSLPFNSLPNKIKFAHFINGAAALSKNAEREKKKTQATISLEELAQRLASVCSGSGYQLAWEAFTDTRSNPKPSVVKEICENLDISDCWTKINPYCEHQGNHYRLILESFIELRNECAHTGVAASPPTPEELKGYCLTLERICDALYKLLSNHLATITTPAALTTAPAIMTSIEPHTVPG